MRDHRQTLEQRADSISTFLGVSYEEAENRLKEGFIPNHHRVAADYKAAKIGADLDKLLDWYRTTDSYIYELSAYHLDEGFNYCGMIEGIAAVLDKESRVLVLGDGIGDFTFALHDAGMHPVYNDLAESKTAGYARFRWTTRFGATMPSRLTYNWSPMSLGPTEDFDVVASLDFFEHVPNVEDWVLAAKNLLRPGGILYCQNAFGLGSGENGSIPMHLSSNDHFEQDWDPLLDSYGFVRGRADGWRIKP